MASLYWAIMAEKCSGTRPTGCRYLSHHRYWVNDMGESVLRCFGLMKGKFDYQWVSHIDGRGQPTGYSPNKDNALRLTGWQLTRVRSCLAGIGAKYTVSNLGERQ